MKSLGIKLMMRVSALLAVAGQFSAGAPVSAGTAADAANIPVQLPPFMVYGSRPRESQWKWGYVSFPGYEVLSGCGEWTTTLFARKVATQISILREIAPALFETQASVPTSLILMNQDQALAISDDMRTVMEEGPDGPNAASPGNYSHIVYFPQLRLHDSESTAINLVIDSGVPGVVILEPGYVRYLMTSRVPRFPAWYVEAMTELYRRAVFSYSRAAPSMGGSYVPPTVTATYPPIVWPAGERAADLLPMGDILSSPVISGADDDASRRRRLLWRSQADLLLQWILSDRSHARIAALTRFLDYRGAGQGTEKAFRECFGMSFEQARHQLSGFLPVATTRSLTRDTLLADIDEPFRDARASESARIWGNWTLLEIPFVRAQNPGMVFPYVEQADQTLLGAYDAGARDPGFLGILGLYESEGKNRGRARSILESAAAGKPAYPRVYTELARLRFEAAIAKPEGVAGRLSAEQVASILLPLREARHLSPPQESTYLLLALAFGNGSIPPTADDLAALDEGQRFFPDDARLSTLVSALRSGLLKAVDPKPGKSR